MAGKKAIDLVLYGATGFTGKLACDYLASKPTSFSSSFKWAIAGRLVKQVCNEFVLNKELNLLLCKRVILYQQLEGAPKTLKFT